MRSERFSKKCQVKFSRTTIEEWTPNEKGGFDIAVSEPMVNDYEYYPFALKVSGDIFNLSVLDTKTNSGSDVLLSLPNKNLKTIL